MPRTLKAASASEPKTRRTAPVAERKRTPVRAKAAKPAALATKEFDVAAHFDEIAQAAYLNWLRREGSAGTPEEDWFQAEISVRAMYSA